MGNVSLSFEQSLELVAKEGARPDVRVLGALSAAAILTHNHLAEFDADMVVAILNVVEHLQQTIEDQIP